MQTVRIPRRSITSYCPGHRRFKLRLAGILEAKRLRTLAVLTTLLLGACRATVAPPAIETVGSLSASDTHVLQAPVHATTDLGVAYQALSADDDAGATTEHVVGDVEAPELAPKAGLVMGGVR